MLSDLKSGAGQVHVSDEHLALTSPLLSAQMDVQQLARQLRGSEKAAGEARSDAMAAQARLRDLQEASRGTHDELHTLQVCFAAAAAVPLLMCSHLQNGVVFGLVVTREQMHMQQYCR